MTNMTCVGPHERKVRCAFCGSPPGKPCRLLEAATDKVLAHKPKPKSKPARKRARRAKKIAQTAHSQ